MSELKENLGKYASNTIKNRTRQIFDSLPTQLTKENTRFQFSLINHDNHSFPSYEESIRWLIDARMVIKCQNLTEFNTPISGYIRPNSFKLYYFDIGLMTASLDKNITSSIFLNDISKFKGVIYENLFADFFYKNNLSIYFLNEYKSYEIDFLIQTNNILYAIEVKTSNGRSKSLKTFQQTYPNKCKGIKFIAGNCGVNDNYITLPQYLGIFIK